MRYMPDFSRTSKYVWEGVVERIYQRSFSARVIQIEPPGPHTEEYTSLSLDDLSDDDRANIFKGAIFRWTIQQTVELRKIEPLTDDQLADIKQQAHDLYEALK